MESTSQSSLTTAAQSVDDQSTQSDKDRQKALDDERWKKTMLELNGKYEEYKPGPIDLSDLDRKFQEFTNAFANLGKLMAEKLTLAMGGMTHSKDWYSHQPV